MTVGRSERLPSSPPFNGGDAAVRALRLSRVDTVFGIPASHVIEIYDALGREPSIRTIIGRNEQACAYSADGYARRARRPGVAVVTGGPGYANAVGGLQAAFADSSPVALITSDLDPGRRQGGRWGVPHEVHDAVGLGAACGATPIRADESRFVEQAVRQTLQSTGASHNGPGTTRRFGPAVAILARGALTSLTQPDAPDPTPAPNAPVVPTPAEAELSRVCEVLRRARRPVVIAGAGVYWSGAEVQLDAFVSRLQVPCVTTSPARSVLPATHPCWAGTLGGDRARRLVEQADCVVAIGTSLGSASTDGWTLRLPQALVHVDCDSTELGRIYQTLISVCCDAREFLERLSPRVEGLQFGHWRARVHSQAEDNPWISALDTGITEGPSTIVGDVSTTLRWLIRTLRCSPSRRLLLPWNSMAMGWSYPAALGAQAAAPGDSVVAVMGDGGALFCLGELATATEQSLPVCLVVFNNHAYGVIAELQDQECDGRRFGVELRTPDFTAAARSFGMRAWTVQSPKELHTAVSRATRMQEPTLIEALVSSADFADSHAEEPIA